MRLANYLQYFANLLFSESEVQSLLFVDLMILWIYHANLFLGILNGIYIILQCQKMIFIEFTVSTKH
jgi:hypothetical protein